MKRTMILAMAAVALTFASCKKSGLERPEPGEPNKLPVSVSLSPASLTEPGSGFSAASLTKAEGNDNGGLEVLYGNAGTKSMTPLSSDDEMKVVDLWAVQFDKDKKRVGSPYYTADIPAGTKVGKDGIDIKYDLDVNLSSCTDAGGKVYFIANSIDPALLNTSNTSTIDELEKVVKTLSSELKPTADNGLPMVGIYTGAVASGTPLTGITMKRLVAKVIVKYKVDGTFTGFDVDGVRLRNAAKSIGYRSEQTGVDFPAKNTEANKESHFDYPAENLNNAVTDGAYKSFTFYVPENLRKATGAVDGIGNRTLDKTDGMATYIELKGTLKSAAKCAKATYSLLLGDLGAQGKTFTDFNVKRNTVYTLTVNIKGINESDLRINVEDFDMNNSAMLLPNSGDAGAVTFDIRKLTNGWQTTLPTLGTSAALRAEVLWSDVASVIKPGDISLDRVNGLLTVKSSQNIKGNAIIALYNNATSGGEILWSWHIWVSDYNPNQVNASTPLGYDARAINSKWTVVGGQVHTYGEKFKDATKGNRVIMDRNLGAIAAYYSPAEANTAGNNADQAFGMFYQWGRKDPFPRVLGSSIVAADATGKTIDIYGPDGTKLDDEKSDAAGTGYRKIKVATAMSGTNTMTYAVKNPLAFIYNGSTPYDWYTSSTNRVDQNDGLWGDGTLKSAYDPCPKGWRIAPNGTWSDFTRVTTVGDEKKGTFPYYSANVVGEAFGTGNYKVSNGRFYTALGGAEGPDNGVRAWYPAPGYRGSTSGTLGGVGNNGYYWSSSVSGVNGFSLGFNPTWLNPSSAYGRANGFQVRCLQE